MCDVSIYDVSVLDEMGEICQRQAVQISGGRFTSIRPFTIADKHIRSEQKIDGFGKRLMPPLADCRIHTGQQFLKANEPNALSIAAAFPAAIAAFILLSL